MGYMKLLSQNNVFDEYFVYVELFILNAKTNPPGKEKPDYNNTWKMNEETPTGRPLLLKLEMLES